MKTTSAILGFCIAMAIAITGCKKEPVESTFNDETVSVELKKVSDPTFSCTHIDICQKNGHMIRVSINAGYTQLEKGGLLFSCDPSVGISLAQIQAQLNTRVIASGGSLTSKTAQTAAFEDWFYDTYCAPDTDVESGGTGGGGTFDEDAGSDL